VIPKLTVCAVAVILSYSPVLANDKINQWYGDGVFMVDLIAEGYEIKAATSAQFKLSATVSEHVRIVYLQRGKNVFACLDGWNSPFYINNPFYCSPLQRPAEGQGRTPPKTP